MSLDLFAAIVRLLVGVVIGICAIRHDDRRSLVEIGVAMLLFASVRGVA